MGYGDLKAVGTVMVAAEPQMVWSTKSTRRVGLPDRLRWSSWWVRQCAWFTMSKKMFVVRWLLTTTEFNTVSESISNNDKNPSWIYDVFLSFCDEDTADSFASYLYTALTAAEIVVFRDDSKLRNQDQIITSTHSVLHAIEGSRLSIIVFSRNYADSTCCLQELEKIMECSRTIDQMVIPVFYGVSLFDVHHQGGMFGEAFKDLAQRISKNDKSSEGSNILGFVVDSR
ncbi:disease resistance protein (TIR-NBS-LRR class) [Trifolium pratense]|uniref:Disease resistance protein (TIR-NBS-LRR class) n=1 Tax=Trifolium pratense TaxID=57577 RepID=A0A2K3LKY9_TRIPR|nr:disease resistance protein (TIR-NBS-LRR class) [Trifolium pratense]